MKPKTMVVAALAALMLAGCSPSTGSAAADVQSACVAVGGTVGPDQACRAHSDNDGYTLDFSFPVSYPDQQALTDFLTHERDQEVEYAHMYPPSNRPLPYEFKATGTAYRSGTPASGTQSLVFRIANDTGAANEGRPATSYKAFNYDLGKGAPITFDTLFKPGTKPVDVQHELEKRGVAVLPSFNDFGVHGYQNFAITDDAVIFFFDHDFLHEGPGKVSVPRTEIATLLA
jgi:hypothetical protein